MAGTLLTELGNSLGISVIRDPEIPIGPGPNRVPSGLAARSLSMAQGGAREYITLVILSDWSWADLQPTNNTTLSAAKMTELIAALDWCWANTGVDGRALDAVWRHDTGYNCPAWLKALTGTYVGYGRDGTNDAWASAPSNPDFKVLPGGVPKYWTAAYKTAYSKFIELMMRDMNRTSPALGGIGNHPALCGVSNSLPCTQFSEPTVKQYGCDENRANAIAAGWTQPLDDIAFDSAWEVMNAFVTPRGLFGESAYNKAESISSTGRYVTDPARSVRLMEKQLSKLGRKCMWSNHGWEGGQNDQVYQRMWNGRDAAVPVMVSLQTRTLDKLRRDLPGNPKATVKLTIQEAADRGVSWVEIPSGCWNATDEQQLTLAYAREVVPQFRNNNAGLETTPLAISPKRGWVEDGAYADSATASSPNSQVRMPPTWAINAGMTDVVLNVGLRELITTSPLGVVSYITNSLQNRLSNVTTWNAANPTQQITAHIRLHVGTRAPAQWRTICGTVSMANEAFGSEGDVPRWWVPEYRDLYSKTWAVLGPVIDSLDYVGSVNNPGAACFYPEPFLLYAGADNGNTAALLAGGWTPELHKSFFRWFPTAVSAVKKKVVYISFNPASWPALDGSMGPVEEAFLQEVGNIHITSRPVGLAGIENYSYAEKRVYGTGTYQRMYAWMIEQKSRAWLNVQEARSQVIAEDTSVRVWDTLATRWFDLGGHGIETTGNNTNPSYVNRWPEGFVGFASTITTQDTKGRTNPGPISIA